MRSLILLVTLVLSPAVFAGLTFPEFVAGLKAEAPSQGVNPKTVDELLGAHPTPNAFIVRRYKPVEEQENISEPKNTQLPTPVVAKVPKEVPGSSFIYSQRRFTSETRLNIAREKMAELLPILENVEKRFGVDKEVVMALWSVESYFGTGQGIHNIPHVLATLAWHPKEKRQSFFRRELFAAFKIYEAGHVSKENFKGSWAGAMGHIQFMPTTFLAYAVDGDGDGKDDIWNNHHDAFASAANYLKKLGWQKGAKWKDTFTLLIPVQQMDFYETGLSRRFTGKKYRPLNLKLKVWEQKAIPLPTGVTLEKRAFLYIPYGDFAGREGYLLYNNFGVIMRWNLSSKFAFGILSIMDELKKSA